MEKVLRRAKYAERQATKKLQKRKTYLENTEAWQRKQNTQRMKRVFTQNIVDARKNRREDWQLGALAPRRDVGEKANTYGSLSIYDFHLPELAAEEKLKFYPISEGDRVVVIKGREKGKIGEVSDVLRDRNGVRVNDINVADVEMPSWMAHQDPNNRELNSIARYIPIQHVRLVYPLPDPETGELKDTIIDRLEGISKLRSERINENDTHHRYIHGTNTIIPWPEMAETDYETFDADTEAMSVEDRSFRPYLLAAPMPVSVIDELRNKYSKFRTRHDPDFVEKMEAEAERVERRKDLGKTMRTPLQELAELRAKQKKEAERELTDEQLAKIGEVIEREENKALGGVQQISQQPQPEGER